MSHQQQHSFAPEVTFPHPPPDSTKRIWKTFWILLIVTIVEVGLGLVLFAFPDFGAGTVLFIKGMMIILTLAKAFYIIAVFMHLGDELRSFILSLVFPSLLFLWFIGAFLWDGHSFRMLKNTYDPYHKEMTTTPIDELPDYIKQDVQTQKEGELK